jgi:hypothetical protein
MKTKNYWQWINRGCDDERCIWVKEPTNEHTT